MRSPGEITVSTDVLGIFSNLFAVQKLYTDVGLHCGLEVVAMPYQRGQLSDLLKASENDVKIHGLHGRMESNYTRPTGLVDFALVNVGDMLLPRISRLGQIAENIGQKTSRNVYVNVHNFAVEKDKSSHLLYAKSACNSCLLIENGKEKGDVKNVVSQIKEMRDLGIEAGGTYDVLHSVFELTGCGNNIKSTIRSWDMVINSITPEFWRVHIPIGLNEDSLPIMDMLNERCMLRDLADKIYELDLSITLENQHNLCWGANQLIEQNRLVKIRDGLLECGFAL